MIAVWLPRNVILRRQNATFSSKPSLPKATVVRQMTCGVNVELLLYICSVQIHRVLLGVWKECTSHSL